MRVLYSKQISIASAKRLLGTVTERHGGSITVASKRYWFCLSHRTASAVSGSLDDSFASLSLCDCQGSSALCGKISYVEACRSC